MRRPIRAGRVAVWSVALEAGAAETAALASLLSPDEAERAGRFRSPIDRTRFVLRRGVLRLLLAGYAGVPPGTIGFAAGPAGKPRAAGPAGSTFPRFSTSHSQGLAVYAFSREVEVGVDVEAVRHHPDLGAVARRFFSPSEQLELFSYGDADRPAAFVRCWTRKEAVVKALGSGLSERLDSFDVSLARSGGNLLRGARGSLGPPADWVLIGLEPALGFAAAVAARRPALRVVEYRASIVARTGRIDLAIAA